MLVEAADCRIVAGVAEWLFGEVLLDMETSICLYNVYLCIHQYLKMYV